MRKCCCCDTNIDLFYVDSADDYFCGFCHGEQFYRAEFDNGYQMAKSEIDNGDIDAEMAILSFEQDPPVYARHWGFLKACIDEIN